MASSFPQPQLQQEPHQEHEDHRELHQHHPVLIVENTRFINAAAMAPITNKNDEKDENDGHLDAIDDDISALSGADLRSSISPMSQHVGSNGEQFRHSQRIDRPSLDLSSYQEEDNADDNYRHHNNTLKKSNSNHQLTLEDLHQQQQDEKEDENGRRQQPQGPKLNFGALGLYGRDSELAVLRRCLDNVKSGRVERQLVLISGCSGTGKTALVSSLDEEREVEHGEGGGESPPTSTTSQASGRGKRSSGGGGGLFVRGKFEEQNREPYCGITLACAQICGGILAADASHTQHVCHRIQTELGSELFALLIQFIPIVAELVFSSDEFYDHNHIDDNKDNYGSHGGEDMSGPSRSLGTQQQQQQPVSSPPQDPPLPILLDGTETSTFRITSPAVSSANTEEAKNRLRFAFGRFIRIVSQEFDSLIFVLDDLQWADASSLDLVESLLQQQQQQDQDSEHYRRSKLLIVGLYRSNQVGGESSLLNRTLESLRQMQQQDQQQQQREMGSSSSYSSSSSFALTELALGTLDVSAIDCIIRDLLTTPYDHDNTKVSSTTTSTRELAEICFQKTLGNSLFLLLFLSKLHDRNFLHFDAKTLQWTWDVHDIRADTTISDNVVDLLKSKLADFSPTMIRICKVAACLGSTFDRSTLQLVLDHLPPPPLGQSQQHETTTCSDDSHLDDCLTKLEEEGYIQRASPTPPSSSTRALSIPRRSLKYSLSSSSTSFAWTHDQIREAVSTLAQDQGDWAAFGFRVGTILSCQLTAAALDSAIFVVVNLLNQRPPAPAPTLAENVRAATLNYQASQKAFALSAFESAAAFAAHGIKLLPERHWAQQYYQLSLGLYSIGAKTESTLGKFETMQQYCDEVLGVEHMPLQDKLVVYHALIDSLITRGRHDEAADLVLVVLKHLGYSFPKTKASVKLGVVGNLMRIKATIKALNVGGLQELLQGSPTFHALQLLNKLCACFYLSQDERFPLVVFRILKDTMKYGYSDYSPVAFAYTGMILVLALDDLQGALLYGKQAVKLVEKTPSCSTKTHTMFMLNAFVFPWTMNLSQLQKPLLDAYDEGFKSGDLEQGLWSVNLSLLCRLVSGSPLKALEADFLKYSKEMKSFGKIQQFFWTKYIRQVLLNLMEENTGEGPAGLLELIGEAMTEEEFELCKRDSFHSSNMLLYQGILLTYFGEHERHAKIAIQGPRKAIRCTANVPYSACLKGVSCYIAASQSRSGGVRRKYAQMAEKLRSKIKLWGRLGNPNVKHYEFLMEAESSVFRGKKFDAIRNYEAAILFAARSGFLHDAAFCSERLGDFYWLVMSDRQEATNRIEQAMSYWREWGAMAKVRDLERKYRVSFQLLPQQEQQQLGDGGGDHERFITMISPLAAAAAAANESHAAAAAATTNNLRTSWILPQE